MEKELEKLVNSKRSIIISGNTCTNKTDSICFPIVDNIIKKEESLFIVDVNNEYYNKYKDVLESNNYKVITLDFKDPYLGDNYNPYDIVYKLYHNNEVDKALNTLDFIHSNIFYTKDAVDPFWDMSAANIASAAALILIKYFDKEYLNINNIANIIGTIDSMDKAMFFSKYYKDEEVMGYAKQVIFAPIETKGGILSVARQKLRLFATRDALSNLMSCTNFDITNLDKTVIFVNINNQVSYISRLVVILLNQILENKNDVKINYILDNFDYLSYEKYIGSLLSYTDNYNKFYVVTRSISRLKGISREYLETLATIVKVKEYNVEINYSDEEVIVVDKVINDEIVDKVSKNRRSEEVKPYILEI